MKLFASSSLFCARARTYISIAPLALLWLAAPTRAQSVPEASKAKISRLQDAIRRHNASAIPDLKAEGDPAVRAWIVRAASRLGPQGDFAVLEDALKDQSAEVRLAAAEELGQRASDAKAQGHTRAIAELAAALPGENSPGVRQTMTFWLGASKGAGAHAALAQAVASDPDANVRAEAAQALKRRGTGEAKKALKQAAQDHDARVRKLAHE